MAAHEEDDRPSASSPPCSLRELADELLPRAPAGQDRGASATADWLAIKRWRAATRENSLAWRTGLDRDVRRSLGERAKARLRASLTLSSQTVLGIYWPIRGEIDVRDVAESHIAAGGSVALPVVVEKNAPLEFWRWAPGMSMRRGFWNIPVPAPRELLRPSVLLVPLVGFDRAAFRLGYGGGYYDRTLAAYGVLPRRIGIGYAATEIATIHPQRHDVPMSLIVTDTEVFDAPTST